MKAVDWIKPKIYDTFQCKGASCRRTCCAGWRITVSKSEYQDLKEKLQHRGIKTIDRLPAGERTTQRYGEFLLEDETGCTLQSKEGLCSLQLSFGAEALPYVCSSFPRNAVRFDTELQMALTPACERVLELLLELNGSLEWIRQKAPIPSYPTVQFSGKDANINWKHYLQMQEFCILLLQAKEISLDHRMALLGIGLHQIDTYYKNGEAHKIAGYIDRYLAMLAQTEQTETLLPSGNFNPSLLLGSFLFSAGFSSKYKELVNRVSEALKVTVQADAQSGQFVYSYSMERYQRHKALFDVFLEKHPFFLENVMVTLFACKGWASLPQASSSIWEQFMYACWVYSNLKLALTACIEEQTTDEEILDSCVVLFRSWIHNETVKKKAIQQLHDNGSDTLAHMVMLVQAG